VGIFDFFIKKGPKKDVYNNFIKHNDIKKPIVDNSIDLLVKGIHKKGFTAFLALNDNCKQYVKEWANHVFLYMDNYLGLDKEYYFRYNIENSGLSIDVIKCAIEINFIIATLNNDEEFMTNCLIRATNLKINYEGRKKDEIDFKILCDRDYKIFCEHGKYNEDTILLMNRIGEKNNFWFTEWKERMIKELQKNSLHEKKMA
jgi:hypothetical protein